MNRFSELTNNTNNLEDFKLQLESLNEILGKPQTATLNFGDKDGYIFKWNLGSNIQEYNGEMEMMSFLKVFEAIKESISEIKLKDYDVEFKIDESFYVRLTPQTRDNGDGYKFVVGQNWRQIIIDYNQVSKFFKDRGYSIKSTKINEQDFRQTSNIVIKTGADSLVTSQFADLLNEEMNHLYKEEETINLFSAECKVSNDLIFITPDEDKTFVVFNR